MKHIPKRRLIPVITDILEYRQAAVNTIPYTSKIIEKYGDVCNVSFTGVRNYFIHDPEVIKEMLVTQASKFRRTAFIRTFRKLLGDGLFTSDGELHKRQKQLMKPAFYPNMVSSYADIMVKSTEEEMQKWRDNGKVNISDALTNITLTIITRTMFGADLDEPTLQRAGNNFSMAYGIMSRIMANPLLMQCLERDVRIPVIKKFFAVKQDLDHVLNEIMASYRERQNKDRTDLLSILMNTRDEETGEGMSDAQVRDELMTIFLAGHETTRLALEWTWYLIGKHPDIANRFYEEVHSVIKDGRKPVADDYKLLPLTRNIFKESLRLYPPAWTFARETLEDVTIKDYQFPKGSVLWTVIYQVHHSGKYFKDPDVFDPDRWDDEQMKDLPKYAYFPFGGGSRMCIGEGFAWMEGVLMLATIASRYHLEMPPGFTTTIQPSFTLKAKDEIIMKVKAVGPVPAVSQPVANAQ